MVVWVGWFLNIYFVYIYLSGVVNRLGERGSSSKWRAAGSDFDLQVVLDGSSLIYLLQ